MRQVMNCSGLMAVLAVMLLLTTVVWPGAGTVQAGSAGAVYTLTNQVAGNEVAIFSRAADGTLTPAGSVATGGTGTGGGLGSQGALTLTKDERWLIAVNAGSDTLSVLAVTPGGLTLTDMIASGGSRPISVTVYKNLVYVLNAGGAGNITGFTLSEQGTLTPLANSTRPLSGAATDPAQVQFSPNGRLLVVTEKATSTIDTYVVGEDGLASGPMAHPSSGVRPFGFGFSRQGHLIVSEAAQRAVSSYDVTAAGGLTVVSGSVPTGQIAACWIAVTEDGRFAYTTNAGSGSISGYRVLGDGSLSLLDADGRTGVTDAGSTPLDMALDRASNYLYVLEGGTHAIGAFRVSYDGSLMPMPDAGVLPVGTVGLAAR